MQLIVFFWFQKELQCNSLWKRSQCNLWSTHKGYDIYTSWHEQTPFRCAQNSPAVLLTHEQFDLSLVQDAMQPFVSQWLHVLSFNPRNHNSTGAVTEQWNPRVYCHAKPTSSEIAKTRKQRQAFELSADPYVLARLLPHSLRPLRHSLCASTLTE